MTHGVFATGGVLGSMTVMEGGRWMEGQGEPWWAMETPVMGGHRRRWALGGAIGTWLHRMVLDCVGAWMTVGSCG